MGRGLADMTGLSSMGTDPMTLRIIPEVRSNALFVTGPADQIRQVEDMLKILDASELPEQLRDRSPPIHSSRFCRRLGSGRNRAERLQRRIGGGKQPE